MNNLFPSLRGRVVMRHQQNSIARKIHKSCTTHHNESLQTFDINLVRKEIRYIWAKEERETNDHFNQVKSFVNLSPEAVSELAKQRYDNPDAKSNWYYLDKEISSNIAGETGAVWIYHGALAALNVRQKWFSTLAKISHFYELEGMRKLHEVEQARSFCEPHKMAEEYHLLLFQQILGDCSHR